MSDSALLRETRTGLIINEKSKKQEQELMTALKNVISELENEFPAIQFVHKDKWSLKDIVETLRKKHMNVEWFYYYDASYIRPDGGILSIEGEDKTLYPILISEAKRQGTNDERQKEGKDKQAKGNAIERLGKNVIAVRTALSHEMILPFVCFGHGCDFEEGSSILDRVVTIAMFSRLNRIAVFNEGSEGVFNRGSFFFRKEKWTIEEMQGIMLDIARRSVHYYLARYS